MNTIKSEEQPARCFGFAAAAHPNASTSGSRPESGSRNLAMGRDRNVGNLVLVKISYCDPIRSQWPNAVLVHTSIHASWLNQIEIYFSIVQRKVHTPNDFLSLAVDQALHQSPRRCRLRRQPNTSP
jgi:hypothetical protein